VLLNRCNENSESESFVSEIASVEALNDEVVESNIKLTNTREVCGTWYLLQQS